MRINKQGISFSYYGDVLTWLWGQGYTSALYEGVFTNRNHYWQHIGALEERSRAGGNVLGISLGEVITSWVKTRFAYEVVVVLWDIDYAAKDQVFWKTLPAKTVKAFCEDIVVFRCKDASQADNIRESVEVDKLGTCKVFVHGKELGTNQRKVF